MHANKFFNVLGLWFIALIVGVFCIQTAQAASFSSGRSFSSPSRSYSSSSYSYRAPSYSSAPKVANPVPPKPVAPPVKQVTVNRTTVVQQNVTHVQQGSSGGGFFSNMAASFAGAGIANWLFGHKEPPPAQPQVVQQTVDCTQPQNKQLQICQPAK